MGKVTVFFLTLFLTTISGCAFHSGPKQKVEFSHSTKIKDLVGVYKNSGDPRGYLSHVLWRTDNDFLNTTPKIQHKEIKLINVSLNNDTLTVEAITNNCVIFKKLYMLGSDFKINNGEIELSNNSYLLSRGKGDVWLGPSSDKTIIGLDNKGHGVYKSEENMTGLLFAIVPMVASSKEEIRFEKSIKLLNYAACSNR